MNFKRKIEELLNEWRNDNNRKPLILRGARQVGKTTLIKYFAKNYKNSILLNLEKQKDKNYFIENNEIKTIVESLFLAHNISISDSKNTLIFIDEIQESPNAIQMLRYFYEEYPQIHVIAAGSLLEFVMSKVRSFPVGRIEYMYLHPLNFSEFLKAIGHEIALEQLNQIPVKPFAHKILFDLFNTYAIIGGMPEVVKVYLTSNSFTKLPKIYESIWSTYQNDVEKYATSSSARNVIKYIMTTAHLYLDKRVKFQNFGNSNYKSREVGEALRNLNDAKIIQLIYPTTDVEMPLKSDLKKSPRLQFLDSGLANHALEIQADIIGMKDLSKAYKGAIIPHIITQELISLNNLSNKKPNFWVREKSQSSSEVDLVFTYKDKIIPIEIKSGATGSLKSLHQFVEKTNHPYAVRIYAGDFKIEKAKTPNGNNYLLMNIPYYLGTKIPEYIKYFIEKY